jgi:non-specific serine/threonine protein kinase
MSHPFGDLLRQYRARKPGLTQTRLAGMAGYHPTVLVRMCQGKKELTGPSGRERVVRIVGILRDEGALTTIAEANALLAAAQMAPLFAGQPAEAVLLQKLHLGDAPVTLPPAERATPNVIRHNLPSQLTTFIGRERELEEVKRLSGVGRLVTLTGSGGCGKTRLALEVGAALVRATHRPDTPAIHSVAGGVLPLPVFPDGVWLVELAPLGDPARVPQTVGAVLGVREEAGRPILETIHAALRDKQLLLILDNCEHLVEACARFADAVLRNSHDVRILATSREALGIAGEMAWRVPSLRTPGQNDRVLSVELARYEAVCLFTERARFASPAFALTAANAPAVQQICARLDGIPLAIELAAARVKVLTAEQIAERIDDRFHLLTVGSRTALPRQQTLRATIDWSYDLLTEAEQALLRRLSVFAGGWTLEAAEAVCGDPPPSWAGPSVPREGAGGVGASDVLDLLTRLVDKSLVVVNEVDGVPRYHLLETIRQYGREKLTDHGMGEVARVSSRHLDYFVRSGEDLQPRMRGNDADQVTLFKRLSLDVDNLRSAVEWASESGRVDDGLRLMLSYQLMLQGYAGEPELVARTKQLLAQPVVRQFTRTRAHALRLLAEYEGKHGAFSEARVAIEGMQAIGLALNDPDIQAAAIFSLAVHEQYRGDHALARAYIEKWRAFVRARGQYDEAAIGFDENWFLGLSALSEGDYARAHRYLAEAAASGAGSGEKTHASAQKRALGYAQLNLAMFSEAASMIRESVIDNDALGDKQGVAACVAAFAALAVARGDHWRAARLFGASEAITMSMRTSLMIWDQHQVRRNVAALRTQLNEAALDAMWAEGRAMTYEQAIEFALQGVEADVSPLR